MQAFDYVLGRLGSDSAAAPLWLEFIDFMAGFPPGSSAFRLLFEPEPGKEASKRALRLRDLYLRALQARVARAALLLALCKMLFVLTMPSCTALVR
jgi:hypothetical protein